MTLARFRIVARVAGPDQLSPFVVGSLAAHVLCLGVILTAASLGGPPDIPEDFIMVDLRLPAAPAPATKPSAPTPVAAKPEPEPPPERARAATVETKPPKRVDPERPKPEAKPEPEPPEPEVVDPPPEQAPTQSPPETAQEVGEESNDDRSAPGPGIESSLDGGSASITAMEGSDSTFAWYRASVTAALYTHWRRPILTGLREPLEVAVAFEITRSGRIQRLQVVTPSGVPSLDRSALRAVSDAAPLPPLPAAWHEPTLSANFVFRLYPEDS